MFLRECVLSFRSTRRLLSSMDPTGRASPTGLSRRCQGPMICHPRFATAGESRGFGGGRGQTSSGPGQIGVNPIPGDGRGHWICAGPAAGRHGGGQRVRPGESNGLMIELLNTASECQKVPIFQGGQSRPQPCDMSARSPAAFQAQHPKRLEWLRMGTCGIGGRPGRFPPV